MADKAFHSLLDVLWELKGNKVLSNSMGSHILLGEAMSWRLGSKTSNPASRTAAERVLLAPNTPLIAMPVRPSHKTRTTALRVYNSIIDYLLLKMKWEPGRILLTKEWEPGHVSPSHHLFGLVGCLFWLVLFLFWSFLFRFAFLYLQDLSIVDSWVYLRPQAFRYKDCHYR